MTFYLNEAFWGPPIILSLPSQQKGFSNIYITLSFSLMYSFDA